jgi:hypothetical protein
MISFAERIASASVVCRYAFTTPSTVPPVTFAVDIWAIAGTATQMMMNNAVKDGTEFCDTMPTPLRTRDPFEHLKSIGGSGAILAKLNNALHY